MGYDSHPGGEKERYYSFILKYCRNGVRGTCCRIPRNWMPVSNEIILDKEECGTIPARVQLIAQLRGCVGQVLQEC